MSTDYIHRRQKLTVIDVEDLHEFQTSSVEEFWTFSFGGFLASGSFWLGVERFFTEDEPWKDTLFVACLISLVAGIVIGLVAYRQLTRRKNKIGRIISAAEARAQTPAAVSTSTTSTGSRK